MGLTTRCLDCGRRTRGPRCPLCTPRRERARNQTAAQRARLAITPEQRCRVYQRDGYRCVDCGSTHDLTLDHLVPLAHEVKPYYRDDEFATRCRRCNSRRGNGFRRDG